MCAGGYVLLETVIATAMLVLGLAVVGTMVYDADSSVRKMERRTRALMLAESHLAEMGMGLIEVDELDEVQEDVFGVQFLDWGWRMTIDDTEVDGLYLVRLEILFQPRETKTETFEYDDAEVIHTLYMFQPVPQRLDLGEAFGVPDDQMGELVEKLGATGIEGLDPENFDPSVFATGFDDFEEFIEVLPVLLDAFKIDISSIVAALPPDLLQAVREAGVLEDAEGDEQDGGSEEGGS